MSILKTSWSILRSSSVKDVWIGISFSLLNKGRRKNFECRHCSTNIVSDINSVFNAPVMVETVLEYLQPSSGKTYIDMTFGCGGHSMRILESAPDIKLFTLDRDPAAHKQAVELSKKYPDQVIPLLGKFSDLPALIVKHKISKGSIDGILFEFGVSELQLNDDSRGFSASRNGPLDMRMDGNRNPLKPTAADVLEYIDEVDLVRILKVYGLESKAKKIARSVIEAKYMYRNLKTTHELVEVIQSLGRKDSMSKISADKTLHALRYFVNDELNEINYGMLLAAHFLKRNGRLIVISYHTLEDTIVKRHISGNVELNMADVVPTMNWALASNNLNAVYTPWKMLHKHVLVADPTEIATNSILRHAKFRAIEKIQ